MHTMLTDEAIDIMGRYVALPFEERIGWLERKEGLHHPHRS